MVYTALTRHPKGLRLLALDGGGVRGIMGLVVLRELMLRVQKRKGLPEIPRPADYFELAGGTSTGGIMGIMLFRLRMTVDDTIAEYDRIAKDIFSPKIGGWNISWVPGSSYINNSKALFQDSRFDGASMSKAINEVVTRFGLDENDKKLGGNAPLQHEQGARMFCCTTAQNRAESMLMRSYKDKTVYTTSKLNTALAKHGDKITINIAARATSAAPTFFPEVKFPENSPELVFWDGGLLNNNPIDQLWYTRFELVDPKDPAPPVSCVISLGTGYLSPGKPTASWFKLVGVASKVMDFATNTNAKGKDFSRHMTHMNQREEHRDTKYIRFNPFLDEEIGLDEYLRMNDLKQIAKKDMEKSNNQAYIEAAVDAICA
ncbi:Calcium-independent phospholipase A2-gamma [Fusarium albosuccineum]|uniref:Calcium-independent phospholipase A2-gamma n=1 Tax=Fusarium albosuccineum TaxID=1237068 RepID=A0A8H4LJC2_9HYPO|nr:Calcium-independent phospholipase A2-gamma [Fusarium albosuccineum]